MVEVHQDHPGEREAAEDVERVQALVRIDRCERSDRGAWRCGRGHEPNGSSRSRDGGGLQQRRETIVGRPASASQTRPAVSRGAALANCNLTRRRGGRGILLSGSSAMAGARLLSIHDIKVFVVRWTESLHRHGTIWVHPFNPRHPRSRRWDAGRSVLRSVPFSALSASPRDIKARSRGLEVPARLAERPPKKKGQLAVQKAAAVKPHGSRPRNTEQGGFR